MCLIKTFYWKKKYSAFFICMYNVCLIDVIFVDDRSVLWKYSARQCYSRMESLATNILCSRLFRPIGIGYKRTTHSFLRWSRFQCTSELYKKDFHTDNYEFNYSRIITFTDQIYGWEASYRYNPEEMEWVRSGVLHRLRHVWYLFPARSWRKNKSCTARSKYFDSKLSFNSKNIFC